jgi:hypothetical protein
MELGLPFVRRGQQKLLSTGRLGSSKQHEHFADIIDELDLSENRGKACFFHKGIPYDRPGMGKMDLGFDCGRAAVLLE